MFVRRSHQIKIVHRQTMNASENPCYRLNKRLLLTIGQWPYQDFRSSLVRMACVSCLFFVFGCTQVAKVIISDGMLDLIIVVVPEFVTGTTCAIKFYGTIFYAKTMRTLLDRMDEDWRSVRVEEELIIMKKYANDGRVFTLIYGSILYTTLIFYNALPVLFRAAYIDESSNSTRARQFTVDAVYFVDGEKYYYVIVAIFTGVTFVAGTIYVAKDTMFFIYVRHVCGMFTILGQRLEYTLYSNKLITEHSSASEKDALKRNIVSYIINHRRLIESAELIETAYTWPFLLQCVSNIITMSATLMKALVTLSYVDEVLVSATYITSQLVHMFVGTYSGQILLDHSTKICDAIYNGKWYNLPHKSQKLLLLMIRRATQPCSLSVGKVCILSLTSFTMVVQTSVSYFTMLSSIR